jgi:RNA polymerase sigma-32 factor
MKKKGKKPEDASSGAVVPQVMKTKLPAVRGSSAVTPSDPLLQYLNELRKYPVLSPEEQQELAQKFRETGDVSLARRLVTTNLRLVVKIALEYKSAYNNVLDLIQEGNVGLMKAVSNYDPYKGTRLSYYASWWIRSYILKFLLDNFRLVKVGTTQAQKKLFYNLMREKDRLEAQGITAAPKLLADTLNVKEKDVREMSLRLSSKGGEFSLDQPVGDSEGRPARDSLVDPSESVDENLARKQLRDILSDHISEFVHGLNEKERIVFQERLMNEEPKTLQEVADQFGITRERARQIEAKVIEKLRAHMAVHMDGIELKPARR